MYLKCIAFFISASVKKYDGILGSTFEIDISVLTDKKQPKHCCHYADGNRLVFLFPNNLGSTYFNEKSFSFSFNPLRPAFSKQSPMMACRSPPASCGKKESTPPCSLADTLRPSSNTWLNSKSWLPLMAGRKKVILSTLFKDRFHKSKSQFIRIFRQRMCQLRPLAFLSKQNHEGEIYYVLKMVVSHP
jgi:hypothetical protein